MNSPSLWKENRVAAVSLVYVDPTPESFRWILSHHTAVGIRATLVGGTIDPTLLTSLNWDLRDMPPPELQPAPADPTHLLRVVEDSVSSAGWTRWSFGPSQLDAMGEKAHALLLTQLGEQHARLWCAPFRDVDAYTRTPRNR